jgi:hypothetical protein
VSDMSRRAEQLAAWDAELARAGRVEIGYGGRSVLYLATLFAGFTAIGVWMAVTGEGSDRVMGVVCAVFFGGGGLLFFLIDASRRRAPLVVDAHGVHLQKPEVKDVAWESVLNAYVLRSLQGPTVALVVVQPDGTTTSMEVGRLVGSDRQALAAWLATKARAGQP